MTNPERTPQPNKHRLARLGLAAAILGGSGAVVTGKVILDELSKPKAAASAEFTPTPLTTPTGEIVRVVIPTLEATPTQQPSPIIEPTKEPTKEATKEPTKVVPDTKPTQQPTVTAAAEKPKEAPCPILSPEFCAQAEVVEWTNPDGEKSKLVGFKLPAGTPILMPIEGNISRGQLPETSPMQGFQATVSDPKNPNPYWYRFYGNIEWITPSPHEKGKAFARIGKTGITNAGGYDLLVAVHRGIGMNTVRAEDELRKMFPFLDFDTPSHKASAQPGSGGGVIQTTGFYDAPPAWLKK